MAEMEGFKELPVEHLWHSVGIESMQSAEDRFKQALKKISGVNNKNERISI